MIDKEIWETLAFPDQIREISKICQNLFVRGDHMAHVVAPFLLAK